jgi:methyl-accepting chemotaxis protein
MMRMLGAMRPILPVFFSTLNSIIQSMTRTKIALGSVLVLIGFFRFFSDHFFQTSDGWLARPGDTLLVLIALFLTAVIFFSLDSQPLPALNPSSNPLDEILKSHLNLDAEIGKKLVEVVEDTENSALKIITEVRQLYDAASTLVVYLDESRSTADSMGQEVVDSVQHLRGIENFVLQLPAQMKSDLNNVQLISNEIKALVGLVDAVKAISMQSHLLSINAAIEGSRAGPSGASFRVVAGEMRKLASNSNEVATQISQGLIRANLVVTGGIASSIAEASQRLKEVLAAADSLQKLQDNFTGITDFYNSRFAVITQHNKDLALNIAEVLGQIQYQDVVSQCIDRMIVAMNERNTLFEDSNTQLHQGDFEPDNLAPQLDFILQNYLIEEEKHKHSARHHGVGDGELKVELF